MFIVVYEKFFVLKLLFFIGILVLTMAFINKITTIFSRQSVIVVRNFATKQSRRRVTMAKNIPFTISIEGNIGSGKTTFLEQFVNNKDICVLSEPVKMWQNCNDLNLLEYLYKDPKKWMFTFQSYVQLTMLMQHTMEIEQPVKCMERSLFSARRIFVENAVRQGILEKPGEAVIHEWFKWIQSDERVKLDLIVYLRTSPEVAYERMVARNRSEECSVSLEYLQNLHKLHEEWLIDRKNLDYNTAVLVVDGNVKYSEANNSYNKYKSLILEKVSQENVAISF